MNFRINHIEFGRLHLNPFVLENHQLLTQTHQVPHVGFPQMAPVISATAVSAAPTGAAAFIAISAILIRQIKLIAPANAIT